VIPSVQPGALATSEIPLLVGATTNEASIFSLSPDLKSYRAMVEETGPAWSERIAALYPAATDAQAHGAMIRLMTDRDFVCPARSIAANRRAPTWLFLFSLPATPSEAGKRLGAFHGADVRLLFDLTYGVPQGVAGERLGDAMRRYWVRFAATGNPNTARLPEWPRYGRQAARYLELGASIGSQAGPRSDACDLFDEIARPN
jgi:para-nitrobenzyl esterase